MSQELWERLQLIDHRAMAGDVRWPDPIVSARRRSILMNHGLLGRRLAVLEAIDHHRRRLMAAECLRLVVAFDGGDIHRVLKVMAEATEALTGAVSDPNLDQLCLPFHAGEEF